MQKESYKWLEAFSTWTWWFIICFSCASYGLTNMGHCQLVSNSEHSCFQLAQESCTLGSVEKTSSQRTDICNICLKCLANSLYFYTSVKILNPSLHFLPISSPHWEHSSQQRVLQWLSKVSQAILTFPLKHNKTILPEVFFYILAIAFSSWKAEWISVQ